MHHFHSTNTLAMDKKAQIEGDEWAKIYQYHIAEGAERDKVGADDWRATCLCLKLCDQPCAWNMGCSVQWRRFPYLGSTGEHAAFSGVCAISRPAPLLQDNTNY